MKFAAVFVLVAFAICCIEAGSIRPVEKPLERPERPLEIQIRPAVPLKSSDRLSRPEERMKLEVPLFPKRPLEDFPPLHPKPLENFPPLRPIANANSPVGY